MLVGTSIVVPSLTLALSQRERGHEGGLVCTLCVLR